MTTLHVGAHGLIEKDGKYLVTLRVDHDDYMPGTWDLPGGSIKIGERVEAGLEREIFEETGLHVKVENPIYVYTALDQLPVHQTVVILFACTWQSGDVTLNPNEHQAFAWKTWKEIQAMENKIHWLQEIGEKLDVVQ